MPSLDHRLGLPTTVGQREWEIDRVVCEFFAELRALIDVGRGSEAHRVTGDRRRGRLERLHIAERELGGVERLRLRDLAGGLRPQISEGLDDRILTWLEERTCKY